MSDLQEQGAAWRRTQESSRRSQQTFRRGLRSLARSSIEADKQDFSLATLAIPRLTFHLSIASNSRFHLIGRDFLRQHGGDQRLELHWNNLILPPGPLMRKSSLQRHCALKRLGTPTLSKSNLASPDSFRQQSAVQLAAPPGGGRYPRRK